MELIPGQVIGRDLVADHNTITINKGTKHGLRPGQAVLTVSGAVGYIFKPQYFTSHVMLITDRYSVVDALIQKTRSHGIVEGKNKETCVLQYVERTEDVKIGDLIVTGGLDNIFPKGFPLGVVTRQSGFRFAPRCGAALYSAAPLGLFPRDCERPFWLPGEPSDPCRVRVA